jgi:antitoxin HigA-1
MKPYNLSANALAIALHIDANKVGEIIKGKRSVTADTALRLASFFNTTPQFWINLQSNYDLSLVENQKEHDLKTIKSYIATK